MAELGVTLSKEPQVLSLDPQYLGDALGDIRRVGRATGTEEAAESLITQLQARIDAVVGKVAETSNRPRVLQLARYGSDSSSRHMASTKFVTFSAR